MTTIEMSLPSTEPETVSHHVIAAVAEATKTDPRELDPLYHVIDPDALDRLFANPAHGVPRSRGQIVFTTAGCEVTVYATGEVEAHQLSESRHRG